MIVCLIGYIILLSLWILRKRGAFCVVCDDETGRRVLGVLLAANTLALGLFIMDAKEQQAQSVEGLLRNGHGEGVRLEELLVSVAGEDQKVPLTVEVEEQQYTKSERQKAFQDAVKSLDKLILGSNRSLDHVDQALNLITRIPDESITVEWECDRYDIINVRGELQTENLEEKGTLAELRGILKYGEDEALYVTNVMVFPPKKSGTQQLAEDIQGLIKELNQDTKESNRLLLPEAIHGKAVKWERKPDQHGYMILLLGGAAGGCLILLKRQQKEQEEQERRKQMLVDYPEILNQFTLLLGAGMTPSHVWRKIVEGYGEKKRTAGVRYAYEEMRYASRQMESKVPEAECYERFGQRCKIPEYLRFGAILSQNLRKGSAGLARMLKAETRNAFEERKSRARRSGEEAGTKLLLPMFLMLAIVLVIVIVPAFFSIHI